MAEKVEIKKLINHVLCMAGQVFNYSLVTLDKEQSKLESKKTLQRQRDENSRISWWHRRIKKDLMFCDRFWTSLRPVMPGSEEHIYLTFTWKCVLPETPLRFIIIFRLIYLLTSFFHMSSVTRLEHFYYLSSVTSKKSPNVNKKIA